MFYQFLADIVLLLHLGFVFFVLFGGLFLFWNAKIAWIHVPTVLWASLLELFGWVCPLTPFENWLRQLGGEFGYKTSFIQHYILPVLYPSILTRELQLFLGILVIIINVLIYGSVLWGNRMLKKSDLWFPS
jgi:hypothetical protein